VAVLFAAASSESLDGPPGRKVTPLSLAITLKTGSGATQYAITIGDSGSANDHFAILWNGTTIYGSVTNGAVASPSIGGLSTNTVYRAVLVCPDNDNQILYVGEQSASTSVSTTPDASLIDLFRIGGRAGAVNYWDGPLEGGAAWACALHADEARRYTRGERAHFIRPEFLVHDHPLRTLDLKDYSGRGNNFTVVGGTPEMASRLAPNIVSNSERLTTRIQRSPSYAGQYRRIPSARYRAPTGAVTVTPGVSELAITGFAPTVTATANVTVSPGVSAVSLTGFAPVVTASDHQTVEPGVSAVAITGFAPTITTTANVSVTPGASALTITGLAPTVTTTGNVAVTPGVAALSITGFAPTTTTTGNVTATPGVSALSLTGLAPTVTVTANISVSPGLAQLLLTGYVPTISVSGAPVSVSPGVAALLMTGFNPTIAVAGGKVKLDVAAHDRSISIDSRTRGISISGDRTIEIEPA
jgi:hypothetical protein